MARTTHEQQLINKPKWGHEVIIENDKELNLCMKILHIHPKRAISWQFHKNKTETFYILQGVAGVHYGRTPHEVEAEVLTLFPGDSFKVYPYQWHRILNLSSQDNDLQVMECSTFHEDSDTYRDISDWVDTGVSKKKD